MSLGVVMLVHTAFKRAEQVARHWANAGCPVVIHVDRNVVAKSYKAFVAALADVDHIRFSRRYRCEWGTWGIVAASQTASEKMLRDFPDVQHVYLASGSCLPLRPIEELLRCPHLQHPAAIHHRDLVGKGERLGLVVSHINHRVLKLLMDFLQLGAQLPLQMWIDNG